jgi:hypothetical protein
MTKLQDLVNTPGLMKKIDAGNQNNLKKVPSGGTIDYLAVRGLVLIGKHTTPEGKQIEAEMLKNPLLAKGKLEVQRQVLVGKGEIKASPPPKDRAEFQAYIARISKKKVFY